MSSSQDPRRDTPEAAAAAGSTQNRGAVLAGLGAYLIWGVLPLYMAITAPASAVEIVIVRVGFSLLFCLVLLALLRRWSELRTALGSGQRVARTTLAALLIAANWLLYAIAVTGGQTLQASLGYYINPLMSVLLGVLVLRERLRPAQWLAVGIAAAAVVVLTLGLGTVPWLSLGLAVTFALYGLAKKRVGASVHPVASLTAETITLMPLSLAGVAWLLSMGSLTTVTHGAGHFWIMAASGIVTALPLILFGQAAAKLPLSMVGLLQYVAPTCQFLVAVLIFGEQMTTPSWIGFGLIWAALIVFTADQLRVAGKQSRMISRARRENRRRAAQERAASLNEQIRRRFSRRG